MIPTLPRISGTGGRCLILVSWIQLLRLLHIFLRTTLPPFGTTGGLMSSNPNSGWQGKNMPKEIAKIASKLMELISLTSGLPGDRFHSYFKDQSNYEDGCAPTVLAQDDTGGLEVRRKSGEWVRVRPVPSAYIINVGDIIQVWRNKKCESVEHRAVGKPAKERFSMAFFLSSSHYEYIGPAKESVNEQNPPKYRPYVQLREILSLN